MAATVEKRLQLSPDSADRLRRLAQQQQTSENELVERALDLLFNISDNNDTSAERRGWSLASEDVLQRVWDNEDDARYDNWQGLYGAPTR